MPQKKYDYEALAGRLFDALVERPEGMVMKEIIDLLDGVRGAVATKVVTRLRLDLGDGDSIAVPVNRKDGEWRYTLASSMGETNNWLITRGRAKLQTIKTDVASVAAIVRGADGRTREGKAAQMLSVGLQRIEEDLAFYLEGLEEDGI